MEAVEDYLENCAHVKVVIEVLERLMEPESKEISPKYILKDSTGRGGNIFQLFDTSEKQDHFVASRRRWLESQGKNGARQGSGQNEWHDIHISRKNGKSPSVLREDFENAVAAAKARRHPGTKKAIGS